YARFNYIAQPEDKGVALMPNIGVYDKYSIAWGYRPILDKTAKEEKATLDAWIMKHAGDPMYRFGRQQRGVIDPSSQTEDLGDNAMKASMYGIKNLKRILPNLEKWTSEKGQNYDELSTMYDQLLGQFNRYMGHVAGNIGGIYEYYKTSDQEGNVYTHVAKDHQKEAVKFLNEQLFETPTWMLDKSIFGKTQFTGAIERIRSMQTRILNSALSVDRMGRMIENETLNGNDAYSVINLFSDLRQGVWSELYNGKSIDTYRRNLQKAHVERLGFLLNDADDARGRGELGSVSANQSDIKSIARGELKRIQRDAKNASNSGNTLRRYHLQDVVDRIDMILDPK
ncbi:MAG: zinc-dependent metalloprotease, partial [Flavobacteriales bacterium]